MPSAARLAQKLIPWFRVHGRPLPWRQCAGPYGIWISEVMLQQTQVRTVIPYWRRWMELFPSLENLAAAPIEKVLKAWEGLGYYHRARRLHAAACKIVALHQGVFPRASEDVLALPGVGRYTAGAICSIAYGQAVPVVDGNVARVLTRLYGIHEDATSKAALNQLWNLAESIVLSAAKLHGAEGPGAINQALMELGATVCLPRNPLCSACPVSRSCIARRTAQAHALPNLPKNGSATKRFFAALVLRRGEKFLVRRRPDSDVNGGLWEFPNLEFEAGQQASDVLKPWLPKAATLQPLLVHHHSITRYRIRLEVYELDKTSRAKPIAGQWRTLQELTRLPFTGAHRHILNHLLHCKT